MRLDAVCKVGSANSNSCQVVTNSLPLASLVETKVKTTIVPISTVFVVTAERLRLITTSSRIRMLFFVLGKAQGVYGKYTV